MFTLSIDDSGLLGNRKHKTVFAIKAAILAALAQISSSNELFGNTLVFDTVRLCCRWTKGLFQPLHVLSIVAFVEVDLTFITVINDVRGDTVKEPTVVRDH